MAHINHQLRKTPVAIVGMSSLFADAHQLEKYWENIVEGIDCIKEIPDTRWSIDDYYDPDPRTPDKTYCKVGGFLPEIDFNPMEFGLPPNILEVTDASQLLALGVARDALIDAGYAPGSAALTEEVKRNTGVILGVGGGQKLIIPLTARLQYPIWQKALRSVGMPEEEIDTVVEKIKAAYIPWTENSFPGLLGNVIAGRIANRFDLGGINSVVDAACAASLSALKMALGELVEGRCDMMITGGVDTDNSPFMYMSFSKTPAFSQKGSIRPFDHESDGMLIGEGVGMVVCKRLEDAIRDGDRIYATIRGIGSSSDGRYKSVYAPRPKGQALAMQRAYDEAGYDASTVGLVEAHGTGTGAGDPSEGESMKMVFGKSNPALNHVALGSVKSQVGHTKAAAGVAGLIKAALALHEKVLPGTINVTKPNPKLDIEHSPLYVNSETRPWFRKSADTPRRAGVSAFGFGGVNVHVAMEEYTEEHKGAYRLYKGNHPVLLQAPTPDQLRGICLEYIDKLKGENSDLYLKTLSESSANANIPNLFARLAFVASNPEEAIKKLETSLQLLEKNHDEASWEHPIQGIWFRKTAISSTDKVVALFSGQGSQYVNMGKELAISYPTIRESFSKANLVAEQKGKKALTDMVYPIPVFSEPEKEAQQLSLTQTQNAQPAIGALSAGMYQLLKNAGFDADFFAGHSYGELTALWAAGVLNDQAFYRLSAERGQAMAAPANGDPGAMLAVKANEQALAPFIAAFSDVQLANMNSASQTILGGSTASLQQLEQQLKANGFLAKMLPVSAAFHTPFVGHAQQPFAAAIQQTPFAATSKKVFSNTSGQAYANDPQQMKEVLKSHMLNPVRFQAQIEQMYAEGGRVFVEFGPKNILTNLVKEILSDKNCYTVSLNPNPTKNSDKQLKEAVMQLAVLGIQVQGFDKYALPPQKPVPKGKINVRISGYNYVSPATKKKGEEALKVNGSNGVAKKVQSPKQVQIETKVEPPKVSKPQPLPVVAETPAPQTSEMTDMDRQLLNKIQENIDLLAKQQSRMEEMLNKLVAKISQQPVALSQAAPAVVANGNGHAATNGHAGTHSKSTVKKVVETKPQPVPQVLESGISRDEISASLLEVIAEKTGYPSEMLELSMDMEADLGIDSIKRVEIFGAMTEANPSVQGVNPQELAELRTLDQIVDYIAGKAGASSTPSPQPLAQVATTVVEPTPVVEAPASTPSGISRNEISASLLEVIAEKTGYPAEMLELSMDMEADLGIDSIKRVEIFGAMTEANPSVQGVNPQELAELRTLDQIVDYISGKAGASSAPTSTPVATKVEAPLVVESAPVVATPEVATSGINKDEISTSLLEVIAEKTGYPAEMLELSMDMEADLGIDSIKRVEIFGAMTEANPSVQGINPQELAELRTLEQIVDYIAGKAGVSSAPAAQTPVQNSQPTTPTPVAVAEPVAVANTGSGVSRDEISESLLEVIAEKTGYPAEMLELSMDMEADLGIDSIKRVEIFGAMTEANPSVQGINPQELAELRTLEQIVDYIATKAGASSTPAPVAQSTTQAPVTNSSPTAVAPATTSSISRDEISTSLLDVIAEKTGYPAEMLELSMDMEADLGIDSIKRVEIFGAMTEANPSVQGINPQELAELRTLEQIVDYISNKAGAASGAEKKKSDELIQEAEEKDGTSFSSGNYPNVPRLNVQLKYIPQPDQLVLPVPENAITLVTNDGTKTTAELCAQLQQRGRKVVVLSMPESLVRKTSISLPSGILEIPLSDTHDETIGQAIAQLGKPVAEVIYLHPHLRFPLGKLGLQFGKEKQLLRAAFFLAKHLKSSLNTLADQYRTAFMTITQLDGGLGLKNPGNVSPNGGGLYGLTKSLNIEWQKVFCRAVDISPTLIGGKAASKIIQELHDADQRLVESAYNEEGDRYTLEAKETVLSVNTPLHADIDKNSVFLVTGGARGVTADCVKQMATTFKSTFILVGRSALKTDEASWSQGITDGNVLKKNAMMALKEAGEKPLPKTVQRMVNGVLAQREIQENLNFIHQQGAKAHYVSADVTNPEGLKSAIDQVIPQTGAITGLIHGAGRLADKLIENKKEYDFDAVYDVKVHGLLAAVQAVNIHDIKHVILFSSVAGYYGNSGQTDYAMANEVLNKIAHLFHKNHPDVHVVSIDWGGWDGGMVSPELKKFFEAYNVSLVPMDEGPLSMQDQLATIFKDQPQVILGGTLPILKAATDDPLRTYEMYRELTEKANPFLQHHSIQGNAVLPIVNASVWMVQSALDLYPGFYLQKAEKAKLFKGIVFDGNQPSTYKVSVKELEKNEHNIRVQVTIASDSGAKLPLNHYQAMVNLTSQKPQAPVLALPNISEQDIVAKDASGVYTDGTLFHGTDFQGVKKILTLNEKGLLLECQHDGVPAERQGQFPVKAANAFLTDIMYQGLLIWVRRYQGCACLPLRTEAVEVFDALPFGKPFYVSLEVLKADDFAMEADITAFDAETGQVYMKSYGAGVTISRDLKWN